MACKTHVDEKHIIKLLTKCPDTPYKIIAEVLELPADLVRIVSMKSGVHTERTARYEARWQQLLQDAKRGINVLGTLPPNLQLNDCEEIFAETNAETTLIV